MKNEIYKKHLDNLIARYTVLSESKDDILKAFDVLANCFEKGHRLYLAGNGGSNADAEHIAGELMKGFVSKRSVSDDFASKLKGVDVNKGKELAEKLQQGLPTIVLSNHQSLNTAFGNDVPNGGLLSFAQQVNVYGVKDDVLLVISTSGNAQNLIYASIVAKAKGMKIIELTGKDGGSLKQFADVLIKAPEVETYKVQELHLPIYHALCMMLEEYFYN